jgi:Family of unknown function (DUF6868)
MDNEYRDSAQDTAVINYEILLVWFLFFMLAHDWMYQFHGMGFIFQWSSLTCFTTGDVDF